MKKKKTRKTAQGAARKWARKPAAPQAANSEALDNIARLWKRTEQAMQQPLTADEQATVAKVRLLLFTLAQDLGGQQHPPLTDAQTVKFTQELDGLLQRPPFVSMEKGR